MGDRNNVTNPFKNLSWLMGVSALAAVYFISARLGLQLALVQENASAVWPPSGIALAALLAFGVRFWPGVFVGSFAANVLTEADSFTSFLIASGNTLEAVVGFYLVARLIGDRYPFRHSGQLLTFVGVVVPAVCIISATVGVSSLAVAGLAPWDQYPLIWITWWLGDVMGVVVLTPFLLTLYETFKKRIAFSHPVEAIMLLVCATVAAMLLFADWLPRDWHTHGMAFLILPVFVWAAYRFRQPGSTTVIVLVSAVAIWFTVQGHGPFAGENTNLAILLLQSFIAVLALTANILAALESERSASNAALLRTRKQLETRVEERTRELAESREKWRAITETSPDHIMLLNRQGIIRFINHTLNEYAVDEVVGKSVYDFLEASQAAVMKKHVDAVLAGGEPDLFETEYRREGHTTFYESHIGPVYQDQQVVGVTISSRDISERKQTLKVLESQMLRNELILQTSRDGFVVLGLDGSIRAANDAFAGMLGYRRDELITLNVVRLCADARVCSEQALLEKVAETGHQRYESRYCCKNGSVIDVDVSATLAEIGDERFLFAFVRDITEWKQAETALENSERMLKTVLDTIPVRVFWKDLDSVYLGCNKLFAQDAGLSDPGQVVGKTDDELGWQEQAGQYRRDDHVVMETGAPKLNYEEPQTTADGRMIWRETSKIPLTNEAGQIIGILGTYEDITRNKESAANLQRLNKQVRLLLESTGEGIIGVDTELRCTFVNKAACQQLGYKSDELIGGDIFDLLHAYREDGSPFSRDDCLILRAITEGRSFWSGDEVLWTRTGEPMPVHYSANPITEDDSVTGAAVVFRNVAEERALARKMDFLASHDPLTGLVNRHEFEQRLQHLLENPGKARFSHVLCYLDLDQFKVVNDTCGHIAGDELLRQLTSVLKSRIRGNDTFARLGGDEFGIIIERSSLGQALNIIEDIRETIREFRFTWESRTFSVGASIGLTAVTEQTVNVGSAMSEADAACYVAKDSGRNRVHVYQADDADLLQRYGEMQWVTKIQSALEEERLMLVCQPIVAVSEVVDQVPGPSVTWRNVSHFEILLRMTDEEGNIIPPGAFIPAAERYNLMPVIDRWVVEHALSWLRHARQALYPGFVCTINLSGNSINDEQFMQFVVDEIERSSLPGDHICFEITETAAVSNLAQAVQFIRRLKALGCQFALDDFGSGMSSFTYLKNLPVDYLKIDGNFVRDIINDPIDYAMVEAIHQVGQVMNIKTIAEFVENRAILMKLKQIGVDYVQGYGIATPGPLAELDTLTLIREQG
jgi:diguanylate cyclase (GGDEF)-like protein/PAS domain S-box-containing protein